MKEANNLGFAAFRVAIGENGQGLTLVARQSGAERFRKEKAKGSGIQAWALCGEPKGQNPDFCNAVSYGAKALHKHTWVDCLAIGENGQGLALVARHRHALKRHAGGDWVEGGA